MWVVTNVISVCSCFFFFFKQKTAYEMRISDWSSDVCSSDLLFALRRDPATGKWNQKAVPLADNATVTIAGTIGKRDTILATAETMLTPPTLYSVTEDKAPQPVQSLPATFDAKDMTVEKRFATSKDGTKIPYFLVRKTGATGPVPALIHAYGGFRAAQ